jgi:amino acid adenylation domain-containing protein
MTVQELLRDLANRGVTLWVEGERLNFRAPDATTLDHTLREAIRERRRELISLLSNVQPTTGPITIARAPVSFTVRCSPAQERFLFSAELDGTSDPYRLNAAFRISGALDVAALRWSLADIVRRHEILRCRFERSGQGFVIAVTDWEPSVEIVDASGSESDLLASLAGKSEIEFDLVRGPHLASTLYRFADDRYVLFVSMHHIVSDGGSIGIFARELQATYAWRAGLAATPPADPEIQFRDVAYSQREDASNDEPQQLAFWKNELETAPPVLDLPTDRPRPPVRNPVGGSAELDFDAALWEHLPRARRETSLTDFQIMLAAFWLLLHKYSGQSSIVIGTPWANRQCPGAEKVIGPLLNLLPLHIRLGLGATIGELLVEVKTRTLAAIRHGQVPFERIVSHIGPQRSTAYSPIFQVMCALEVTARDIVQLAGLTIEALELPNEAPRYDLAIVLQRGEGALRGTLKYNRSLFDEATARQMSKHFVAALKFVLDDPTRLIATTQLLSETEKNRLLVTWNLTDRDYPLHKTLVDFFNDRVALSPDRVAVEYEGHTLTYGELNAWANKIAHRLLAEGVTVDDVVGITLDRSLELVAAILGALKSGAAYLAIDAQHPLERRTWMLEDSRVKVIIGQSTLAVPEIDVHQLGDVPEANPEQAPPPESGCYVIYTSGSTGVPKGVVVDHRAIANYLLWMNEEWPLTESDIVLFKSSPGFDVSVKEIFWPLIAGARLLVAPPRASGDPEQLCRIMKSSRVSVVHMVPTMLDYFLRHESSADVSDLRIVMCGGEALTPSLRARFHQAFDAVLLHLYGPTEAAIAVTGYAINADHAEVERLPLGRPMSNCRIYLVDRQLQPMPVGVPGELCIAGTPLARGYLYRPELTAEKFVPDLFTGIPGSRMYLTGDLARWRKDGQIEYIGRIDRQIKLGGHRIEPGEIEAILREQDGVDDALVLAGEATGQNPLVAFIASKSPTISVETIQRALRARLPAFMVPSRCTILPVFPTNVNGKIDIAALPWHEEMPTGLSRNRLHGNLEERIALIWRKVLNLEAVDRNENFFDLGGHSLLILQLQAQIREHMGRTVAVADLFLHPTVASLATHLSESKTGRARRWLTNRFVTGKDSAS